MDLILLKPGDDSLVGNQPQTGTFEGDISGCIELTSFHSAMRQQYCQLIKYASK